MAVRPVVHRAVGRPASLTWQAGGVSDPDRAPEDKAVLHRYLQHARDAMVWKLGGLGEYDLRRPLVPSGTNLLGLVKHLAGVEAGYLGATFGRPFPEPMPWLDAPDADPEADLYATADQSREEIVGLYRRVQAHADATIDALGPQEVGSVPWWPEQRRTVTLQRVLVHVVAETHRHAGHADILREMIDGAVGLRPENSNVSDVDRAAHRERLERLAGRFRDM